MKNDCINFYTLKFGTIKPFSETKINFFFGSTLTKFNFNVQHFGAKYYIVFFITFESAPKLQKWNSNNVLINSWTDLTKLGIPM